MYSARHKRHIRDDHPVIYGFDWHMCVDVKGGGSGQHDHILFDSTTGTAGKAASPPSTRHIPISRSFLRTTVVTISPPSPARENLCDVVYALSCIGTVFDSTRRQSHTYIFTDVGVAPRNVASPSLLSCNAFPFPVGSTSVEHHSSIAPTHQIPHPYAGFQTEKVPGKSHVLEWSVWVHTCVAFHARRISTGQPL